MIVNNSTDINKNEQYGASHLTPLKTNKIMTFGDGNKGPGLIRHNSVNLYCSLDKLSIQIVP
jgi:hypothetical protein